MDLRRDMSVTTIVRETITPCSSQDRILADALAPAYIAPLFTIHRRNMSNPESCRPATLQSESIRLRRRLVAVKDSRTGALEIEKPPRTKPRTAATADALVGTPNPFKLRLRPRFYSSTRYDTRGDRGYLVYAAPTRRSSPNRHELAPGTFNTVPFS